MKITEIESIILLGKLHIVKVHTDEGLTGVGEVSPMNAAVTHALVEHARHSARPATVDALLTASTMIWQLADEHAFALTEAYREATAELLLAQQRRRSALVEALLTGHPGPEAGPWEAASRSTAATASRWARRSSRPAVGSPGTTSRRASSAS
jgi:hypothetical protein